MVTGAGAWLALAAALLPAPAAADCRAALLAQTEDPARAGTAVRPSDIATLRDFGPQHVSAGSEPSFSVSPDGGRAALILRRGDPERDDYCIGVVVVPLDGHGEPRLVDAGGELILAVSDVRGIPDLPIGNAKAVRPAWSPDGERLAYLRRDQGLTRVWVARADGAGARPVSMLASDARGVRWAADGETLLVRTRPGLAAGAAAIEAEERSGFLYDRRFWTLSQARPRPPLPLPEAELRIDPEDGRVIERLEPQVADDGDRPAGALLFARSASRARAWLAPDDPDVMMGPAALKVEISGRTFTCTERHCAEGVGALWWGGEDTLFFLDGGTAETGGVTRLLRWRPERDAEPDVIVATADALMGCQPAAARLVCARETATHPRVIASIDPASGAVTTVYDPNPDFGRLRMGGVQRLSWRDGDGVPAYGDLVLPPGHRPGERHPLIIVQYHSRGFLRGGTGDEYPIHALATRGFAVLSVERPRFFAAGRASNFKAFVRLSTTGFAERRRVLASIEAGIDAALARGVVDPERIGITGLSDGAASVQFALVNSDRFRAAAMSSCCDEPSTALFAAGPGYRDLVVDAGYPPPGDQGDAFWSRYSLARNARRLRTPILLQLTDDEYRFALETFVTLDHHRVPIEMHVFADAFHQKWRPAQRLASYERAIDWFEFWLMDKRQGDPAKAAQYARWRALAARQPR